MHTQHRPRPHYAWLICLGGVFSFCASMGMVANLLALCLPDIISDLHLTNAQGSWLTTTRFLFTLITMLRVNELCDRFGLRQVITFGAGLVGVAYLLLSRAQSFAACCFACALLGIAYCLSGPVPMAVLIGRWFESRRSLALGLSSAGSGLVTIIVPPILTRIRTQFGLSTAFVCLGVLGFLLCAALWLLIRSTPQELSLSAYCEPASTKKAAPPNVTPPAMSHAQKCAVLLSSFLMAASAGPGFAHIATFFRSEGYDEMLVATLISCFGFVLLGSKVLCGQVYDRFGGRLGNLYTFGLLLAGHVLFLLAPAGLVWLAFLSIAVYAMGIPISSVSAAKWAGDLSSPEDYASSVRSFNMAYSLGSLVFSPVPGLLADRFGSFLPTYILFGLLLLISLIILQLVYGQLGVGKRR